MFSIDVDDILLILIVYGVMIYVVYRIYILVMDRLGYIVDDMEMYDAKITGVYVGVIWPMSIIIGIVLYYNYRKKKKRR